MNTQPLQLIPKKTHRRPDRFFSLTSNNSKYVRLSVHDRFAKQEVRGVHWGDGPVSLKTGAFFTSMTELRDHFGKAGTFDLIYDDEVSQ